MPVAGADNDTLGNDARGPLVPQLPRAYALDGRSRALGDALACPAIELIELPVPRPILIGPDGVPRPLPRE